MAEKKVTQAQKQARAAQIGEGISRKIIEKGRQINASLNNKAAAKKK